MDDAIEELFSGQKLTIQLKVLVKEEGRSHKRSPIADELIENILRSFNNAIEHLQPATDSSSENNGAVSVCSGSNGNNPSSPAKKNGRGSYKRKRGEDTWTILSSSFHDGHSWRKYGQKEILNCKFPRSYFRCSRKKDQGCQATKHVQMMDDDPQMCKTTYMGQHTCKEIRQVPPIISDSDVKRGVLGPVKGSEGGADGLSDSDMDLKRVFPVACSPSRFDEFDADIMAALEMNCGHWLYFDALQDPIFS